MSRIAPMSYAEALRIVARDDERVNKLDTLLGGLIFAAAPITLGASFALVDPKSEAIKLIRDLTGTAAGRVKGTVGKSHLELLEAAHTMIGLSAFFDAFAEVAGHWYADLELTDDDRHRIAGRGLGERFPRELRIGNLPMPTPVRDFEENLSQVEFAFHRMMAALLDFLADLEAWERVRPGNPSELISQVVARAKEIYRGGFTRLSVDIPEFGFWTQQDAVSALSSQVDDVAMALGFHGESLAGLHDRLTAMNPVREVVTDVERMLAQRARSILDKPIWPTATTGLAFPSVREGFISPNFRMAVLTDDDNPADRDWWESMPTQTDLAGFLTRHLTSPGSAKQPLILLGHPGAGKSLLSKVVAASVPPEAFTTILVELRRVAADAKPFNQIKATFESNVHETLDWGALRRESKKTKVVIFDGLDELIQATGTAQTDYIEAIAEFQESEWEYGNAVVTIVTSRHLVMDRVRVPAGATAIWLEDFSDEQVQGWIDIWNRANEHSPGFRPLAAEIIPDRDDLARQPLLMVLLSIYAASTTNRDPDQAMPSGAELYRELLSSFITRQIRDKATDELSPAEQQKRESHLRRDLSIAALAMFNRGRQFITEEELSRDLRALAPVSAAESPEGFAEPLSRAKSTVAAFFFIHVAYAHEHEENAKLRSYEFLHATFGEYLVAEYVVAELVELARFWKYFSARDNLDSLIDDLLFAVLSHRCLAVRDPVITLATQLLKKEDPDALRDTLIYLFSRARESRIRGKVAAHAPTDVVQALATYTANLAMLLVLTCDDGIRIEDLTSEVHWASTVRLWRAALDPDGLQNMLGRIRSNNGVLHKRIGFSSRSNWDSDTARLAQDYAAEIRASGGQMHWSGTYPNSFAEMSLYRDLTALATSRWPVPPLGRMTPFDENQYRNIIRKASELGPNLSYDFFRNLLTMLLDDGPYLDPRVTESAVLLALGLGYSPSSRLTFSLAHRCPRLMENKDFRKVMTEQLKANDPLAFLLFLSLSHHDEPPALVIDISEVIRFMDPVSETTVVTEMVAEFAGLPFDDYLVISLVEELAGFSHLTWPRVAPQSLIGLLANRPDLDWRSIIGAIDGYIEYHRSAGTPEESLADLVALVDLHREPAA